MNPLFVLHELFHRIFERKWVIVLLIFTFLLSTMCGIVFVKTPVFYDYHLKICDRFLDRVCYSDRSVFFIFLERSFGNALFLGLLMIGGIHPLALSLPTVAIAFRAYTFGGTLTILFTTYEVSGAMVALTLYLPIHLLLDAMFLFAAAISFTRAFSFRFDKNDLRELLFDYLKFLLIIILICILEALLLAVLFHPIGNLL